MSFDWRSKVSNREMRDALAAAKSDPALLARLRFSFLEAFPESKPLVELLPDALFLAIAEKAADEAGIDHEATLEGLESRLQVRFEASVARAKKTRHPLHALESLKACIDGWEIGLTFEEGNGWVTVPKEEA